MPESTRQPLDIAEQQMPIPNGRPSIQQMVLADLAERELIGIQRYGTPLQAFNGRDGLRDAYEEVLDLSTYLRQVMEERAEEQAQMEALRAQAERVRAVLADWSGPRRHMSASHPTAELLDRLTEAVSEPAQTTQEGEDRGNQDRVE